MKDPQNEINEFIKIAIPHQLPKTVSLIWLSKLALTINENPKVLWLNIHFIVAS